MFGIQQKLVGLKLSTIIFLSFSFLQWGEGVKFIRWKFSFIVQDVGLFVFNRGWGSENSLALIFFMSNGMDGQGAAWCEEE